MDEPQILCYTIHYNNIKKERMNRMKIPAELFIKNRFKLKTRMSFNSCLVLFGADEMPRNGDQYFPFRQNSDFFYLTGINQEKSILLLCPGHANPKYQEVLFILKPTPEMETWEGRKLRESEASEISGIKNIQYLDSFERFIFDVLSVTEKVYLNKPELPKFSPEIPSRDERMGREIREKYPYHQYQRIAPLLRELRTNKEAEEVAQIQKASEITALGFKRVLKSLKPGMNEKEVEAELWYEFIRNGANGHAFPPIIASGVNACSLHYTDNNKIIEDGELVLMDFGAEFNNYAADCSRTIPANGVYSDRQRDLYEGLLEVFKKAREVMKPGITIEDVHKKVCEWMIDFHKTAGLYTEEDIQNHKDKSPLWFKYYMHGTGHSVGLDVHDTYDKYAPMAPGMVFTCEPGIYIMDEQIGIRIENDILITRSHDSLSNIS
jgi:Xaa-Pro aminopeptidase